MCRLHCDSAVRLLDLKGLRTRCRGVTSFAQPPVASEATGEMKETISRSPPPSASPPPSLGTLQCRKEKFSTLTPETCSDSEPQFDHDYAITFALAITFTIGPIVLIVSVWSAISGARNFTATSGVLRGTRRFRPGRIVKPKRESRAEGNCTSVQWQDATWRTAR